MIVGHDQDGDESGAVVMQTPRVPPSNAPGDGDTKPAAPRHETALRLQLKAAQDVMWDLVSLGEVMLRFDPEDERITRTRNFKVWEGGGEYNVARGPRRWGGARPACRRSESIRSP